MDNKSYTCSYCKKEYKSMSSLNFHQKTAKFCIKLQNKSITETENYTCNFCNKVFTLKQTFNIHSSSCKEKKIQDENNKQKTMEELNDELQKAKEDLQKAKEEIEKLKLTIHFKDEQINKLEKTNNVLVQRPTSVINNNNDNRKTQYNIQFNQLFEKLDVLNESNINKRINTINTEDQIREYNVENFTNEFTEKLIDIFKDLTFCTDQSRKTVVIKDKDSNSIKMSVEEMLTKCLNLGTDGFRTHFTLTEQVVDERINNEDQTLTSEMLDKFEEQIKELKQYLIENKDNIDLKDKKTPLKKFTIPFIRSIEQHYKK